MDEKAPSKASNNARAQFKVACETWLPKMEGNDLQHAIDDFADVVSVPAEELALRDKPAGPSFGNQKEPRIGATAG